MFPFLECLKQKFVTHKYEAVAVEGALKTKRCRASTIGWILYVLVILTLAVYGFVEELTRQEGGYWSDYRLGDAVKQTNLRLHWYNKYSENYPESIAEQFLERFHKNYEYIEHDKTNETLSKLEELQYLAKVASAHAVPSNEMLVVHVRIGDAFQNKKTATEAWEENTVPLINYVRVQPKKYYEQLLFPINFTSVVIVASDIHHSNPIQRKESKHYLQIIMKWFQKKFPNAMVRWRGNHNTPDSDFSFMCGSYFFVRGSGGFSKLVSEIVLMNNRTVF